MNNSSKNFGSVPKTQTININYQGLEQVLKNDLNKAGLIQNDGRILKWDNTNGYITDTDFNENFLSNVNLSGVGNNFANGQVLFGDGSRALQNSSNLFWDNTNNRLGINTNAPSYGLDLVGDAGKTTGTAWINTSDSRTKQNIVPFVKGLNEINQIEPVYYEYNGKYGTPLDGKKNVGLIADAYVNLLPECIKTKRVEDTDILQYDGNAMDFMLINAVKELSARVQQLEAELYEKQSK